MRSPFGRNKTPDSGYNRILSEKFFNRLGVTIFSVARTVHALVQFYQIEW